MLKANINLFVVIAFLVSAGILNSNSDGFPTTKYENAQSHNSNTTKAIQELNMPLSSRSEDKKSINENAQSHNSNTTKAIQELNMPLSSRSEDKKSIKNNLSIEEKEDTKDSKILRKQLQRTARAAKTPFTEMTISLPRFHTDVMGNWVYNPWGLTFGKIWEDTRFNVGNRVTLMRLNLNSEPMQKYYPYGFGMSTVCMAKSSLYNKPPIAAWLPMAFYNFVYANRRFYLGFRNELYKTSEECHTTKFADFREYQECALRRNQRLEYLLPKYPTHQVTPVWGYKG